MAGESKKTQTDELIEARRQYEHASLSREQLHSDPIAQFENWLKQAREAKLIDATAMALTTVDSSHRPHTRMVLLKQFDSGGFVWFTDQSSAKGQQLTANAHACILFFWRELERQVRIEGQVEKLEAGAADEYFYSRPDGSRFSAASSNQSTFVENRQQLEQQVADLHKQYPDGNVPRPERWGGYRLVPDYFEFWQGRNDRLHDRFCYQTTDTNPDATSDTASAPTWAVSRMSP